MDNNCNSVTNYKSEKPDFIIIGAMKCATSALHDQLKAQETFFMTSPKEPNFFSDEAIYSQGLDWYQALFSTAKPGQIRGESSTHYTKLPHYPQTLARMKAFHPKIKCIYMMRHPVDRLISHYIHEWTQRVISCDINTAVERFPELVDYSRYSMQLKPYLTAFGNKAILPVFSERFRENPVRELRRIFRFLGVNDIPVFHPEIRSNISTERMQACAWRDALVNNPVLSFVRRSLVPRPLRNSVKRLWIMKDRPELAPTSFYHVETIFNDDLKVLGSWLGINLDCTSFKQQILKSDEIEWNI